MKKILKDWKAWLLIVVLIVAITVVVLCIRNVVIEANTDKVLTRRIEAGEFIEITDHYKELLREKTINYIKEQLKTPSTAEFETEFKYECDEENIIKVTGYVDSQNSFGVPLRTNFVCEYYAIGNIIDTLVYSKCNNIEVLNIKEIYIREQQKQQKLEEINKTGKELNQEKLEHVKKEFNGEEWNDVGEITNVNYGKEQSTIDVKITAENDDNYWINYNICSILGRISNFEILGVVKITLKGKEKVVEITFDNDFLKNTWKENHQINLVKELFGENYKEL